MDAVEPGKIVSADEQDRMAAGGGLALRVAAGRAADAEVAGVARQQVAADEGLAFHFARQAHVIEHDEVELPEVGGARDCVVQSIGRRGESTRGKKGGDGKSTNHDLISHSIIPMDWRPIVKGRLGKPPC